MATFLTRPSQPHQDQPPSPPDPATFHTSNVPQRPPPSNYRPHTRASADYRGNGTPGSVNGDGSLPIIPPGPPPHMPNGGPRHRATVSGPVFDGPRSPPNAKSTFTRWQGTKNDHSLIRSSDTAHVPCKFFRSGQCQAGKACPFSHSTDISTVDTPCKYFSKVRRDGMRHETIWH